MPDCVERVKIRNKRRKGKNFSLRLGAFCNMVDMLGYNGNRISNRKIYQKQRFGKYSSFNIFFNVCNLHNHNNIRIVASTCFKNFKFVPPHLLKRLAPIFYCRGKNTRPILYKCTNPSRKRIECQFWDPLNFRSKKTGKWSLASST